MFKAKQKIGKNLDKRIMVLEERLLNEDKTKKAETLSELEMLVEIRDTLEHGSDKISKDAWLAAGISIGSILLVLNYEKADVLTSKAFSLLRR